MTKGTADSTGIKSLRRSSRFKSKTTDDLPTGSEKTTKPDDEENDMVPSNIKPPIAKVPDRAHSSHTAIHDALEMLTTELRSLRAHVDHLQAQQKHMTQQPDTNAGISSPRPTVEHQGDKGHPVNSADNNATRSPPLHPLPPSGEVHPVNSADNNATRSPPLHPLPPSGEVHPVNFADNNAKGSPLLAPLYPPREGYPLNNANNIARASLPLHFLPPGVVHPVNSADNNAKGSSLLAPLHPPGEAYPLNSASNNARVSPPLHPLHLSGEVYPVNSANNNAIFSSPLVPLHPTEEGYPLNNANNIASASPPLHPLPPGGVHPLNSADNNARGSPLLAPLHPPGEAYPLNSASNKARVSPPIHPLPPSGEARLVNIAVNDARGLPYFPPLPSSREVHPINSADNNVTGSPPLHPFLPRRHLPSAGEPHLVNSVPYNATFVPFIHSLYPGEAHLVNTAVNNARGSPTFYPLPPSGEPHLFNPAVNNATGLSPTRSFHPSAEACPVNPAVNDVKRSPSTRSLPPSGVGAPCHSFCLPPPSELNTVRHIDDEPIKFPSEQSGTCRTLQPAAHASGQPHGITHAVPGNTECQQLHKQPLTIVDRKLSVDECINQAQTIGSLLPDKALWCGTRDPSKRAFAETRQLVTTSSSYKWSPPCTQYFLTRQAYAPFIVQKLDLWEAKQDYGPLESVAQDPHSAYWKEATQRQWSYLSTCYDRYNLDSLESRWRELRLTSDIHWDDYITRFEVVASQLAQARGVEALTQAEVRVHLYLSLPKALQAHCVANGYNVGVQRMNYDGLVATCAGWCELNWQTTTTSTSTAGVNSVSLSTSPSPTSTSAQKKTDNKPHPFRPSTPFRQRVKDDDAILNDDYNIKILSSRCQRCLSESHDTTACCEELTRKDERCYHCGLIHHHSRHCPTGYDNYRGPNCERCNKVNHAARACRRFRPCSAQVAAATPIANSSTPAGNSHSSLSFIDIHVNNSADCILALVDSGAAVSVINSSTASTLSLTVTQTSLRIRLADLSETAVRGVAKSVDISFSNGFHCTEDLYILDGCAHQLILSVGLLRRLKAIWHLHGNYITFGDTQSSQPIPMMSAPKHQCNTFRTPFCSSDISDL